MIDSLQISFEIPPLKILFLLRGHFQEDKLRSMIRRDFSTRVDTSQVNAQVS